MSATQNVLITAGLLGVVAIAVTALVTMDPRGERGRRTGSKYTEEVMAATAIDPALLDWTEAVPLAVPMDAPRALALDAKGRIYVIGDRLTVLGADGSVALRSDTLTLDYRALAVDAGGHIVAAATQRIDLIDIATGAVEVVRSVDITGRAVNLTAVTVTTEGIFAADAGGRRVVRLSSPGDGNTVASAEFEAFVDGFFVPSTMDLTTSADGELVTVDPGRHHVQTRDGYGDVVRQFGQRGNDIADFHGCCNPTAIAVMPTGSVVAAEKGIATTRVKVYSPNGDLDSVVAGPDQFDRRPDGPPIRLDVAVDGAGRILVLDPARRQVRVFGRKAR